MVARESALIGLKAMLPSSLIQMSLRRSASTGHLRPPAVMASLKSRQRCETVLSGSPMENRVPSRCWTTPGSLELGGRVDDAADGAFGRQHGADRAVRVDALEPVAVVRAAEAGGSTTRGCRSGRR